MTTAEGAIQMAREKNKNKATITGKLMSADRGKEELKPKEYTKGLTVGRMEGFRRGVEWTLETLDHWAKKKEKREVKDE